MMQPALQTTDRMTDADHDEMLRVGMKAFRRICDFWNLKNKTAAALLDVEPRTWTRIKSGTWTGKLTQDQVLRLSALVGLYKGLHLCFGDQLADRWPTLANSGPPYMGRSPVEYMEQGGLPALLTTRGHIDAVRGGM